MGGKIKNIKKAKKLFKVGADKIVLNSEFVKNPLVLKEFSHSFGAQSIVISLDFKKINGRYKIFYNNGKIKSQNNEKYLFSIINQYAGEVLINSIDYDGLGEGYDYNLINYVYKYLRKPIILCGGAGEYSHFAKALKSNKLDGVSSANFFQFQDQSVYYAKKYLYDKKFNVRKPSLFNIKR